MKYEYIKKAKKAYPVYLLCRILEVSRTAYYSWSHYTDEKHDMDEQRLIILVKTIHRQVDESYGSRRMATELTDHGIPCGRVRASTLMKKAGVSFRYKKKFRVTTDSRHNLPVAKNLLDREFTVNESNKVWCADITYLWTHEGWLYLAAVMDLYNRQIIGWSMGNRINRELVIEALKMAICRKNPSSGLLCHSDQGKQYCSKDYQDLLKAHGMICSMSRKGDCWDNAVIESFFATMKKERVYWKNYFTRFQCRKDIIDYIERFYNCIRRHSHLGHLSPMQFEKLSALSCAA